MRLKEIKPGMVIHCKTQEEKKALLEEADRLGYKWNNHCVPTDCRMIEGSGMTIHFYEKSEYKDFKHLTWSDNTEGVTEFSDLILPELTPEEAVEWLLKNYYNGNYIIAFGHDYSISNLLNHMTPEEIVSKISQWKAKYEKPEKKEPEIEWVYRVFGAENYGDKFFQTEDEAIKRCEELAKSQKTKQYARYERVCRVKEV